MMRRVVVAMLIAGVVALAAPGTWEAPELSVATEAAASSHEPCVDTPVGCIHPPCAPHCE